MAVRTDVSPGFGIQGCGSVEPSAFDTVIVLYTDELLTGDANLPLESISNTVNDTEVEVSKYD